MTRSIIILPIAIGIVFLFFAVQVSIAAPTAIGVSIKINAPSQVKAGDEFVISFMFNKGDVSGIGHMKQILPAGFVNAAAEETKGSEFRYIQENNIIKFTWIALPPDQEFQVSYKITAGSSMPNGTVIITGQFFYLLNGQKQTLDLTPVSVRVVKELLSVGTGTTSVTSVIQQKNALPPPPPPVAEETKEEKITVSQPTKTKIPENNPEQAVDSQEESNIAPKEADPAETIVYRVQLGAYAQKQPLSAFKNAGQSVEILTENGLYKYVIGSHASLQGAFKQRDQLVKLGYTGAFVVAYKNNKRVPAR